MCHVRSRTARIAVVSALSTLAACSDEFAISFSTSSIKTIAVQGSSPSSSAVVVTASGQGPAPSALYVGASVEGSGVLTPIYVAVDPVALDATITISPDTSAATGSHVGTITLLACKDTSCTAQFPGSPHRISYDFELVGSLTSAPKVAVTAVEGTVGAALSIPLPVPATATVSYTQDHDWLGVSAPGNDLVVTPDARALVAGTYQANIALRADSPSQMTTLEVTFTVTPALLATPHIDVTLDGAAVPGDTAGTLPITEAAGATLPAWHAVSDAPWLILDQATGNPGDSVGWHIDLQAAAALDNFASQLGHVAVDAGPHATPVNIEVVLHKALPEITNLDRFAVLPGQPGPLMVYGNGFLMMHPSTQLHIAGVTPGAISVLSDHALQVALPALAAGEYSVTLSNTLGIPTRSRTLSVLTPVDRSYQAIETAGDKPELVWDPVTQSAFAVNLTLHSILRFDLSQTPVQITAKSLPGVLTLGTTLDRSLLVATDSSGGVTTLRASDLSVLSMAPSVGAQLAVSNLPIAVTGDDRAWVVGLGGLAYDLDRAAAAPGVAPAGVGGFFLGVMSPDGRRMLVNDDSSGSSPTPMLSWDTVEGQLHNFGPGLGVNFTIAAADHAGQRWVLGFGEVYGFDLATLGRLAVPGNFTGVRYSLSRNGTRGYVFALAGTSARVYVFDTTGPLITTTTFPLLGSFDLADAPSSCDPNDLNCSPFNLTTAITDDDRTLLAIGVSRLLVIPIPAQFQSH
jgi:hypothetical protein